MAEQHFQRILVPIDFQPASEEAIAAGRAVTAGGQEVEFSPASLKALSMAVQLAGASKGTITLLHVTPPLQSTTMYTGPVALPAGVIEEIHAKAKQTSLAALQHLCAKHCEGVNVEQSVGPGQTSLAVLDEAARINADLIVMAASGRSRVARFFVGSTADRVIREASCPVLVIPAS